MIQLTVVKKKRLCAVKVWSAFVIRLFSHCDCLSFDCCHSIDWQVQENFLCPLKLWHFGTLGILSQAVVWFFFLAETHFVLHRTWFFSLVWAWTEVLYPSHSCLCTPLFKSHSSCLFGILSPTSVLFNYFKLLLIFFSLITYENGATTP